jgi:hypothetical protein
MPALSAAAGQDESHRAVPPGISQFILDGAPFLGKVEHFRARAFRAARLLYDKKVSLGFVSTFDRAAWRLSRECFSDGPKRF